MLLAAVSQAEIAQQVASLEAEAEDIAVVNDLFLQFITER